MSMFKRYYDKAKCTYFMIKDEQNFDKHKRTLEKVSNITIKKFNSGLIYNKII